MKVYICPVCGHSDKLLFENTQVFEWKNWKFSLIETHFSEGKPDRDVVVICKACEYLTNVDECMEEIDD